MSQCCEAEVLSQRGHFYCMFFLDFISVYSQHVYRLMTIQACFLYTVNKVSTKLNAISFHVVLV